MPTTNLTILQAKAEEILKAEVAALLQNFGKVSSKFIAHYASDEPAGHDYDLKRVADPAITVNLILNQVEITSSQGVGLISALTNSPIWGSLQPLSQTLGASVTGSSTAVKATAGKVRTSSRASVTAGANPTDASLIRNRLISALYLAELFQTNSLSAYAELDAKDRDAAQQQFLKQTKIQVLNADASFSELLLLMWDSLHGDPDDQQRDAVLEFWIGRNAALQRYLATCHGIISSIEKETTAQTSRQPLNETFVSTAFGCEKQCKKISSLKLDASRDRWLKTILSQTPKFSPVTPSSDLQKVRSRLVGRSEAVLRKALGETQRANNDVTLWDYVSTIATLYKAAVAKALLENQFVETRELKWRLLSIRYDGLEYLSRAHRISDLLARRDTLEAALDEVKAVIEVEYPMGNEIYRDENGSVLLVPHMQESGQRVELHEIQCGEAGTLEKLLQDRFSQKAYDEKRQPLDGEIRPVIALSDEFLGKQINLTQAPAWNHPPLQPDPAKVSAWWSDKDRLGEVCTICGLRPQGFGAPDDRHPVTGKKGWNLHLAEQHQLKKKPLECEVCKAIDRQVCWVCMERRDDRSEKWANNADGSLKRTIWTDEVADNAGRLALVVGRFVLDGWLDGSLIPTMQKSASFARIQRCWRTTQEFWQEVEKKLIDLVGKNQSWRLKITPDDPAKVKKLGPFHVYDLELRGRNLSVVWTGNQFITADNLEYFGQIAALAENSDWKRQFEGKTVSIFESSAHLGRRERRTQITVKDVVEHEERYSPVIPILAQPSLFMALVPADKALAVIGEIKHKYEEEMGKVRDRLPLHVGIVFAPRRTPVRALLEAGRRMLEMPDQWENRTALSVNPTVAHHEVSFDNGIEWKIPAVMGDRTTPDQWYPHLLTGSEADFMQWWKDERRPELALPETIHARKLGELGATNRVFVRPSRFDFEFLDTAGRRFEISYNNDGRRRGSAVRPFLLEDLGKLNDLWDWLIDEKKAGKKKLSTSHLQHLKSTLTSYITEWFGGDIAKAAQDAIYQTFAKDVLHRLDPKWWNSLGDEQQKSLEEATTSGLILDLLELRMHVLKEKSEDE